jgi:histidinol-phosphate aminotransferase
MEVNVSIYWSEKAKSIEPYVPGEQPRDRKYIKLNTNENPYPPSPRAIAAINKAAGESLKLYPDPDCSELRTAIAEYYNVKKGQVFAGNGSDEILAFSFLAFFNPGRPILFPDITYTFYPVYCRMFGIDYRPVPLDGDFNIPVEQFCRDNGGIIFPNPNAPTSKFLPLESVREILKNNLSTPVIVDEAYIDFGGESAVSLLDSFPNLLVIQTFSKARSLAGLRVGFAIGSEDLIEALDRVKNSFNSYTMDRLAIAGAVEAIRDTAYFSETRHKIMDTRERITVSLRDMKFKVVDSSANFIFISHPLFHAETLFTQLKDKGILVRYFNKSRINNYLRVTIGSDEEMDCLLHALEAITLKQN